MKIDSYLNYPVLGVAIGFYCHLPNRGLSIRLTTPARGNVFSFSPIGNKLPKKIIVLLSLKPFTILLKMLSSAADSIV